MTRQEVEQAAARWLMRREEQGWTAADEVAFQDWLSSSVSHKAAFWRLEYGWQRADRVAALGLSKNSVAGVPAWRSGLPVRKLAALAASIALMIFLGVGVSWKGQNLQSSEHLTTFQTPVGQQDSVKLADGSAIELNTATIVRTSITSEGRTVWLDDGEAFFDVEHIEGRPFIVHAGNRTITVLGTRFSVRRDGDEVDVSVLEGRVQIGDAEENPLSGSAIVPANALAVSRGSSILVRRNADRQVRASLAWRQGMLVFDRTTLAKAVSEFNRYSTRRIVIEDPEVAQIDIGGSFHVSNVDAFLRLLADAYGLQVRTEGGVTKISSP